MSACLNCNKTEQEIPLLKLTFQGKDLFICPQCMPVLIHKPQALKDKIPGFNPRRIYNRTNINKLKVEG